MPPLSFEHLIERFGEPLAWRYLEEIEKASAILPPPSLVLDPESRLAQACEKQDGQARLWASTQFGGHAEIECFSAFRSAWVDVARIVSTSPDLDAEDIASYIVAVLNSHARIRALFDRLGSEKNAAKTRCMAQAGG